MLTLSRKVGETIIIADDYGKVICEFVVCDASRMQVRLAFSANHTVKIYRKEVWDRIQINKEQYP